MHLTDGRTHYHLIYGTRHHEGLRVFREVERAALLRQQEVRSLAQQRKRIEKTGQFELYSADNHSGYCRSCEVATTRANSVWLEC